MAAQDQRGARAAPALSLGELPSAGEGGEEFDGTVKALQRRVRVLEQRVAVQTKRADKAQAELEAVAIARASGLI